MKALRKDELRLTQEAFAERAGISVGQLSIYENGRQTPSLPILQRIAERLGKSIDDLDPGGDAYDRTAPRGRKQTDELRSLTSRHQRQTKEVTVDDPRRFEFVSLFDSLVRDSTAQEELVTIVRRYVARRLGNK